MRIDLRYPIIIGSFYLPGVLMLIGSKLLGYQLMEARDVVAFGGGLLGVFVSLMTALCLLEDDKPIWIRLWGEDQ